MTSGRRPARTRRAWPCRARASAAASACSAASPPRARPTRRMSRVRRRWRALRSSGSGASAASGSRRASASRSAGVLYSFSSSESECEYGRMTVAWTKTGPFRSRTCATASPQRAVAGEIVGAVAAEHAQPGKCSTSREMSPPGVCTSTGTEIA